MTMRNYGKGSGKWSIDHILAKVYYSNSLSDQMRLHNLGNLAPHFDNASKGTTLPGWEQLRQLRAHWPVVWGDRLPPAVWCPPEAADELRNPQTSPPPDFVDLIDYSLYDESWVISLQEEYELS